MNTVGERLKSLRVSTGNSQAEFAKLLGVTQSTINRYENDQSEPGIRVLLWYADYFNVSLDYIFCRTDNPSGKHFEYQPQNSDPAQWKQFVEMCFDPNSPMNDRLKEMMMNMMEEKSE